MILNATHIITPFTGHAPLPPSLSLSQTMMAAADLVPWHQRLHDQPGCIKRSKQVVVLKCMATTSRNQKGTLRDDEYRKGWQGSRRRVVVKSSSNVGVSLQDGFGSYQEEDDDEGSCGHNGSLSSVVVEKLEAFYRFSRPHTVIGTIIGITSVSLLPLETVSEITPAFVVGLIKAVVPSVCMNIYVVGLNQLFDVEIDKINKPTLPLASAEFSMATGVTIVAASLIMSLYMGVKFQSPPLLAALLISFLLGSAYSVELPLMRWKKHAVLAASCILVVRAVVVQLAFFLHVQKFVLGKPVAITRTLVFATAFMCFFSAVIALFKDIPDVDGDRDFGIQSFTVKLGQEKVFWVCVKMLLVAYGAGVVMGASSPSCLASKIITVAGHSTLAATLWLQAQSVDLNRNASITSFYMFIWKLFYAEYFLIPFLQ